MTIYQCLEWATKVLFDHGETAAISTARLDAELILAKCLQVDRLFLVRERDQQLTAVQLSDYQAAVASRKAGMPLAYIVGVKEFWGLTFEVNQHVLVPRPETELLVEDVLRSAIGYSEIKILELGVGSGCISIALLLELRNRGIKAECVGVDISGEALRVAERNATQHGVLDGLRLLQSDWFAALDDGSKFDFIVTNPPYIAVNDPEVGRELAFEPARALYAEADGLACVYSILGEAHKWIGHPTVNETTVNELTVNNLMGRARQRYLWCEIGHRQAEALGLWFENNARAISSLYKHSSVGILKDLGSRDRIFYLEIASN